MFSSVRRFAVAVSIAVTIGIVVTVVWVMAVNMARGSVLGAAEGCTEASKGALLEFASSWRERGVIREEILMDDCDSGQSPWVSAELTGSVRDSRSEFERNCAFVPGTSYRYECSTSLGRVDVRFGSNRRPLDVEIFIPRDR